MIYLSGLRRRPAQAEHSAVQFPLSLPLIRDLEAIAFTAPVTFLVGENGSGKSTLLEGIAVGAGAVAMGAHELERDPSLAAARRLAGAFFFARSRHARTRLFLRAEDVFGFTKRVADTVDGLQQDEAALRDSLTEGVRPIDRDRRGGGPAWGADP